MDERFKKINCNLCGSDKDILVFTINKFTHPFNIVRCSSCGLVYINPMFTEEILRSFYNEDYYSQPSEAGDRDEQGTEDFVYFDERENIEIVTKAARNRLQKIEKLVNFEKGRLLDIGCAFGGFLRSVKQIYPECEVSGVDISEDATAYAREKLGLNVFTGPLSSAKFPDQHFDVIVMSGVIEHLNDPMGEMQEINRIIKPGGIVVIDTVDVDSIEAKITAPAFFVPGHLHYFSRKTIKKLFEKSNFTVEKIFPIDYNFYIYSLLKISKRGQHSKIALLKQIIRTLAGNICLGDITLARRMVCYVRKNQPSDT